MKIIRVTLHNYRCHENLSISLSRGINLLLGENGSGKSSLLEAVGLALFNADLRNDTYQKDAIQHGKRNARIVVDIEGNDEKEYRISRQIGDTPHHRLEIPGESGIRLEGKKEVLDKIRSLVGIPSNEKFIYQNVITAAQNKLVNIFLDTDVKRQETFNQIFNTEIYRTMHDKYLKEALNRYTARLQNTNKQIETLSDTLKDSRALKQDLKAAKKQQKILSTTKQTVEKEIAAAKKDKTNLEKIARSIQNTEEKITHSTSSLQTTNEHLKEVRENVEAAVLAESVLAETRTQHERHQAATQEYRIAGERLAQLEKSATALTLLNNELQTVEVEKIDMGGKQKAASDALKKTEATLITRNEEAVAEEKKHATILAELHATDTTLAEIENAEQQLDAAYTLYSASEESITGIRATLASIDKNTTQQEKLEEQLKTLYKEIKPLPEIVEQERACTDNIIELKSRLAELHDAEGALGKGTCPIFREPCRNLQEGTSPEDYFEQKRTLLEKELAAKETEANELLTAIRSLKTKNDTLNMIRGELEQLRKVGAEATLLEQELALHQEKCTLQREKMAILLAERPQLKMLESGDVTRALESLKKETASLHSSRDGMETQAKDRYENLLRIQKEIKTHLSEKETLTQTIYEIEKQLKEAKKKETSLRDQAETLSKTLLPLPDTKAEREQLEKELESLKEANNRFTANQNIAEKRTALQSRMQKLTEAANRIRSEIEALEKDLTAIRAAFDPQQLEETRTLMETLEIRKSELDREEGVASQSIHSLETIIQENEASRKQVQNWEKEAETLENKIELTEIYRKNIKNMGRMLADRFLRHIEKEATNNFRKITGRGERVRWINTKKEAYAVYLSRQIGSTVEEAEQKNATPFPVLSGGEQTALALSIRSAMASFLTRSNFAIFDEPTINLDVQRRESLAENLNKILKDLDQAMIVTHDDTFREMAQAVHQF